jgi:hypothetical protein
MTAEGKGTGTYTCILVLEADPISENKEWIFICRILKLNPDAGQPGYSLVREM